MRQPNGVEDCYQRPRLRRAILGLYRLPEMSVHNAIQVFLKAFDKQLTLRRKPVKVWVHERVRGPLGFPSPDPDCPGTGVRLTAIASSNALGRLPQSLPSPFFCPPFFCHSLFGLWSPFLQSPKDHLSFLSVSRKKGKENEKKGLNPAGDSFASFSSFRLLPQNHWFFWG